MIKKKSIFKNLFSNHTITAKRLAHFGGCVYIALNTANKNGVYTAILSELHEVLENLEKEICNVGLNLQEQKWETETLDALIERFVEFMKDSEPFIASALGGRKAAGYKAFYPRGAAKYEKANKTSMEGITGIVYGLAEKYSEPLGAALTSSLQAFKDDYKNTRSQQQEKKSQVGLNRASRNSYFVQAQWVLTATVHQVAFINRSNTVASEAIFPFEKLYPQTRSRIWGTEGSLEAGEMKELLNRERGKSAVITVRNTGVNADVAVWVTDEMSDTVPVGAIIIKALSSRKIKAVMLKDMKGGRLMIANLNNSNKAFYEIEISGLKKEKKRKSKVAEAEANVAPAEERAEELKIEVA